MKFLVFFACVYLCSAFPKHAADIFKFEISEESGSGSGEGSINANLLADDMPKLTKFVELIKRSGLQETLFLQGPFTLFAPSDEAFSKLPNFAMYNLKHDSLLLRDVILYHIVEKKVRSTEFQNDLVLPSRLQSTSVRINVYGEKELLTVNGCQIVKSDNSVSNGIIHIIDDVMYPIPVADISTMIRINFGFSTLMEAVRSADLTDTLKGGHYTLFAPTDEAFLKLSYDTLETILSDKEKLLKLINNHLVDETIFNVAFKNIIKEIKTVNGETLTVVNTSNGITINGAEVYYSDNTATNGVIFVIDTVLVPQDMKNQ